MSSTNIEWAEHTWNPLAGCTRVSEGCRNCYAEKMAKRLQAMGTRGYEGVIDKNGRWSGRVNLVEEALTIPLRLRKPTTYFVNSMSDLFHEAVSFDFIDKVFAVMASCPQHTFQVLTKRPERMAEYFSEHGLAYKEGELFAEAQNIVGEDFNVESWAGLPLPNVWLGTSCEDQAAADERIPHLLRVPAAVRFLSVEPLLGPVVLSPALVGQWERDGSSFFSPVPHSTYKPLIHWVIVGGESGPRARPCAIEWIRSIVEQCKAAWVSCFVKQLGSFPVWDGCGLVANNPNCETEEVTVDGRYMLRLKPHDRKGGSMEEWPEDLRIRETPERVRSLCEKEVGDGK